MKVDAIFAIGFAVSASSELISGYAFDNGLNLQDDRKDGRFISRRGVNLTLPTAYEFDNGLNIVDHLGKRANENKAWCYIWSGFSIGGYLYTPVPATFDAIEKGCVSGDKNTIKCVGACMKGLGTVVLGTVTAYTNYVCYTGKISGKTMFSTVGSAPSGRRKRDCNTQPQDYCGPLFQGFADPDGIKLQCENINVPCFSTRPVDDVFAEAINNVYYAMATGGYLNSQFTLYYPQTDAVVARCKMTMEMQQFDSCCEGITGGRDCLFRGDKSHCNR